MPHGLLKRTPVLLLIITMLHFQQLRSQTFYTPVGVATTTGTSSWNMTPSSACTGAYLAGAIWCTTPVNFNLPFTLTFQTKADIVLGSGADGICAVFGQNLTSASLNGNAGYLGYYNPDTSAPNAQFLQSFAVEYDIFNDYPIVNDPTWTNDHAMIARDGNPYRVPPGGAAVTIMPSGASIKDNVFHHYKITWCPASTTLNVYFEDTLRMSSVFDYRTIFTTTTVNWGFTAGIGSSCSDQYLQDVVLTSAFDTTYISSDTSACALDSISAPGGYTHYSWYNGDTTQTIAITASGNYWVILTDNTTCSYVVDTIHATILTGGVSTTSHDTDVCGTSLLLSGPPVSGATYLWNTGATTKTLTATTTGLYWVSATTACTVTTDTFHVILETMPVLHLTGDTTICQGNSITLSSPGTSGNFLWSTGLTATSIIVNTTGIYTLTVTSPSGACSVTGTVDVTVLTADTVHAVTDTALCGNVPHTLTGPPGYLHYLWSTSDTTSYTTVSTAGTYWVAASFACALSTDTFVVTIKPLSLIHI